jgi:AraC family transcriptional regulator, positive regulator of tynA and feaB
MEWSAKPSQIDQPFGSWADDLAAAFVQLEPRKISENLFQGRITRTEAALIRISRVTATKHRVLRLRSRIARSKDHLCFINLQLEGFGRYAQRGHEQICGLGDLAVVDASEPFEIANGFDFRLFCFAEPRQLLPACFCERPRLAPNRVRKIGLASQRRNLGQGSARLRWSSFDGRCPITMSPTG